MRASRSYLYAAIAVALAVAYGVWVGSYWVTDADVFALLAGVVAYFSLAEQGMRQLAAVSEFFFARTYRQQGTNAAVTEPHERERLPRSRIAHYVNISRIRSTIFAARDSDSPFERALLSEPDWRTLSGESLEEISRKVPDASAKNAQ